MLDSHTITENLYTTTMASGLKCQKLGMNTNRIRFYNTVIHRQSYEAYFSSKRLDPGKKMPGGRGGGGLTYINRT